MRVKLFLYILAWLFCFAPVSRAQQYLFARYTPKDGLINNRVRFLYQDSKGRLYISTYGGLSVYDGSRFINYTTENGLVTSLVNDIVEMGDDSLWIIPNGAGLHCMVHGILRDIKMADNFYPVINQLLKCSDGSFYAIADEGLFRLEHDHFQKITLQSGTGQPPLRFLSSAIECNRQLFIITDPYLGGPKPASLLVYDLDSRKLLTTDSPVHVYSLAKSPANDILAATGQGIRKVDPQALRQNTIRLVASPPPYQQADSVTGSSMLFDNSRDLWVSTTPFGKEIIKIGRDGRRQSFSTANGLPDGTNNSVFQDRENNIWFASNQNGITKLVDPKVQFYSEPQPGFTLTDMFADPNSDSVWFYDAIRHDLLLHTEKGPITIHGVGPIPSQGHIIMGKNAYLVSDNKIYGLHFLPGNRFRASLIYQDTVQIDGNASLDRNGSLVLLPFRKLILLQDGKVRQRELHYSVDQAAIDKYNRVWAATRDNILSVFAIGASANDPAMKLIAEWTKDQPAISPRSLTVDNEGRVWIGTRDHGLYCLFFDGLRLVSWQRLTIRDGLPENFINYLYCDPDNTVWACTPAGLCKIRYDAGRFSIANVNPGRDINQTIVKVQRSRNNIHWAFASGGYLKIGQPEEKKDTYQPQILFSEVMAGNDQVTAPAGQPLSMRYDRNALSFYIGATTFTDESQTRFSYWLEGSRTPQWSAPSTQSTINFVNLPPGKYTLRVKAQFLTGRYPEQIAAYPFVILPPWWATGWFRALALAALIILMIIGTRSYIRRRLAKQRIALERQQAIEKERTRIATDMHDDLGAGLSRIKFLSETIGIKRQQQLPIEEEIMDIREYSHEMIDKMGEIVWALNEKNDSLSDLLSYTRSYAVEYLLQAGIHSTVELPGDFPSLFVSGEFRRNVYLTIKEALHNIVKHAQAENVCIHMEIGHHLTITIRDDGIGFDRNNIRPFSNGLYNMQQRIQDIGGRLTIRSGSGTTLRLSVPL
jgi:signal transduction histidine kinase/ligand-binding sensor domain-containing protein